MNAWRRKECNAVNHYAILLFALFALAMLFGSSSLAYGQVPNDDFENAIAITSLPFTAQVDISSASIQLGEPSSCYPVQRTVWYSFSPAADTLIRADMIGSSFSDTVLSVYQGTALNNLSSVACGYASGIAFLATAGQTYYVQSGSYYSSGTLQLNLNEILPPPNDNFENAWVITELPFLNSQDTTAATIEQGEPTTPFCVYNPVEATIWYAFTPAEDMTISAYIANPTFMTLVAAYIRDGETGGLIEIGCHAQYGMLTILAEAGVTYYFQTAGMYSARGPLSFGLEVAPPPIADFYLGPGDPSIFDTIYFNDSSNDPANVGIQTRSWDFGDGATAADCCPTHRYSADGAYTVSLTVWTPDGRSASTSRVVRVMTHDVAITRFITPKATSSGQTRAITVGINSKRYPEDVTVRLLKGAPGYQGWEDIGSLRQSVPVRSANRTTSFNFNYTFTSNDAEIGKVTFRAVAVVTNNRDAMPGDNEATAFPTKVSR